MNKLTKTLVFAAFAAFALTTMNAQTEKPNADKTHRVVFEVTMEGAEQWTAVLNNVEKPEKVAGRRDRG